MRTQEVLNTCDAGVCERKTPFTRALAVQSSNIDSSPAPDLELFKPNFPGVFFSRGVFFSTDTGVDVKRVELGRRRPLLTYLLTYLLTTTATTNNNNG